MKDTEMRGLQGQNTNKRSPINNNRTQDEMVNDVFKVLSTNLSDKAKKDVIYAIFSDWTELHGKLEGCKFWSRQAMDKYRELKKMDSNYKPNGKDFIHEHAIPKTYLLEALLDKYEPTLEYVEALLFNGLNGVVITVEENKTLESKAYRLRQRMPDAFYQPDGDPLYCNPWARYIRTGIELYFCDWSEDSYYKYETRHELFAVYIPEEYVKIIYGMKSGKTHKFHAILNLKTLMVFPMVNYAFSQNDEIDYIYIIKDGAQINCVWKKDDADNEILYAL
ncbi:hypothetical protein [Bacillus paramycoides]|uniref:Uncharacterized protein n=1 Tax=Bacillus paramycoides TaxID=2026194 RepID=A0ABU6MR37_9BACI|nr:hypothetical protein [Bacillus paramycoides]